MFENGGRVYKALVKSADSTTGEINVSIPQVFGQDNQVSISYIGRSSTDGVWKVPSPGSMIIVATDDDQFSNVFWIEQNSEPVIGSGLTTQALVLQDSVYTSVVSSIQSYNNTTATSLYIPDNSSGTIAIRSPLAKTEAGSGYYWRPYGIPFISSLTYINSSTTGFAVSSPYVFDTPVTISEIGFRTGTVTPSTQVKIAIYGCASDTTTPRYLMYTSSAITLSVAGTSVSLTGLSVSLSPGFYWFFIWNQSGTMSLSAWSATATGTNQTITPFPSMPAAMITSPSGAWFVNSGTATPPSTLSLSPGVNLNGYGFPVMGIRRSA